MWPTSSMAPMPSEVECPQCHHTFEPGAVRPVDPGVIHRLTEELTWSGQEPTERMYSDADGTCILVRK